ncbi:hypothetical protein [Actinomadura roseirufa]|uniref:hypothetical protein n=1 Tax=Actinomadura roseirufa TaxID=2094049 RepID=UPI001041B3D7|nr:hypothetical protein [Actinomadura roseirufa]
MGNPRAPEHGRGLFALFAWLTGGLPWRLDSRPYPAIVLEPAGDGDADPHLDELKHVAGEMGLTFIAPDLPDRGSDAAAALALIDTLSHPLTWSRARSPFGRLRFPRSDLVRTIQAAAAERPPGPDGTHPPPPYRRSPLASAARWNEHAGLFRWQGGTVHAPAWWSTIGASVVAVIAVLAGGIAEQTPRRLLVTAAAVLAAALLLVAALSARRIWLPVLSRAGFGGRYRWFARTSFFAVLGEGDEDGDALGFEGRLHRVLEGLCKPDAARFLLQIKTFALLEDMRDQHRKLAPSLRGFKRPAPPVVFLARAGRRNGGLAVLSAMSDIRTRRSEFHPLIIIASVDAATRDALGPAAAPEGGGAPRDRYEHWRSSLGLAQGPSEAVPLPWLLRIPVDGDPAAERTGDDTPDLSVRRRPRWTWLWSRRSLLAAVVLAAIALTFAQTNLRATYCSVGLPVSWNADTHLQTNDDGSRECVGVSTGGVRFERGADSIGLDGDRRRPSPANTGAHLTLADLQRRIEDENRAVVHSGKPYVTIVYVGVFTAGAGQSELTVSSVQELAGAYLAQTRNNRRGQPGEIGNPLRVRLLPANAGQDMAFAPETAGRILRIARRDPSVVGVVGIGRNTAPSRAAIERLTRSGLPVVNTVNSSDLLPDLPHYYGLASTDHDEAAAIAATARAELGGRPVESAMLVHRAPGPSGDAYSREIADDVTRALRSRRTEDVEYVGIDDVSLKVRTACDKSGSYTLVFFAGRAEDMPGLMNGLTQGGCTKRRLLLFAGDDITKSQFGTGPHQVPLPANMTVYHTAFVHLPSLIADNGDQTSDFFLLARNRFGIGAPRVRPDEPLLVNGQMALGFDAAVAVGQAAQSAFGALGPHLVTGGRAVTSGAVLLELRHLHVLQGGSATGDIDFRPDSAHEVNGPGNRGLTMIKVTARQGSPVSTPVCGRLNGARPAPHLPPCPH